MDLYHHLLQKSLHIILQPIFMLYMYSYGIRSGWNAMSTCSPRTRVLGQSESWTDGGCFASRKAPHKHSNIRNNKTISSAQTWGVGRNKWFGHWFLSPWFGPPHLALCFCSAWWQLFLFPPLDVKVHTPQPPHPAFLPLWFGYVSTF